MRLALLAYPGFAELDVLVPFAALQRVRGPGWEVALCGPEPEPTSVHGVRLSGVLPLAEAERAEAVLLCSGPPPGSRPDLALAPPDPQRQWVGALGAGTLLMVRLGVLPRGPVCADAATARWLGAHGVPCTRAPLRAQGRVATAAGPLSGVYLAAWAIAALAGPATAGEALHGLAPVGEEDRFVRHALAHLRDHAPSLLEDAAA